jgi:DNA-binding IclR family transcriptional regulator
MPRNSAKGRIQSLQKGMRVLRKFALEKETWGPREIAKSLEISKSSALRVLQTLQQEGFLTPQEPDGKYTIGPELWRLGIGVNRQMNIVTIAEPILRRYVNEVNETIYLFTYTQKQLVYEIAVECSFPLRYHLELGVPYDLHRGAAGKVVLAYLPKEELQGILKTFEEDPRVNVNLLRQKIKEVQSKGHSFTVEERVRGIIGFAAPIFGANNVFLGGITLTILDVRYVAKKQDYYADLVKHCAAEISAILNPERIN